MILKSLLFPTKNLCYLCKEKSSNIKNFTCSQCYENLDFVHKEIDIDSIYVDRAFYVLSYNRYIKELIHGFKFNGKSYLYKPFAEFVVDMLIKKDMVDFDLIMYVPIHRRKEAIRGYNQCQLLAQYISEGLELPISKWNLIKQKWTKEQNTLSKIERLSNLEGSFFIKYPGEISGKRILLIDDLLTTGSTFNECSKVLKSNGAKEITALALTSSRKN